MFNSKLSSSSSRGVGNGTPPSSVPEEFNAPLTLCAEFPLLMEASLELLLFFRFFFFVFLCLCSGSTTPGPGVGETMGETPAAVEEEEEEEEGAATWAAEELTR